MEMGRKVLSCWGFLFLFFPSLWWNPSFTFMSLHNGNCQASLTWDQFVFWSLKHRRALVWEAWCKGHTGNTSRWLCRHRLQTGTRVIVPDAEPDIRIDKNAWNMFKTKKGFVFFCFAGVVLFLVIPQVLKGFITFVLVVLWTTNGLCWVPDNINS